MPIERKPQCEHIHTFLTQGKALSTEQAMEIFIHLSICESVCGEEVLVYMEKTEMGKKNLESLQNTEDLVR